MKLVLILIVLISTSIYSQDSTSLDIKARPTTWKKQEQVNKTATPKTKKETKLKTEQEDSLIRVSKKEKEWKTVYTFSGSSSESTDDFVIKSSKWRIVWKADKQYKNVYGGNVAVRLVGEDGEEELIINTIPTDRGKTIIRKKGTFYFNVFCVLAKWKIEVQEIVNK